MLFRREMLGRIASGEVTLALRRWKRPTIKTGSTLRTVVGVLRIGKVEQIRSEAIDEKDAAAAGFADVDAARALLKGDSGAIYRIEIDGIEPDERVALRENGHLDDVEAKTIREFLDGPKGTARYRRILGAVGKNAGRPAREIAAQLGLEKEAFKRDVRRLKELGLTESLDTGYKLSSRGKAALLDLERRA